MKYATVLSLALVVGLATPFAGQSRTASGAALEACAEAIRDQYPELPRKKALANRRSGSLGRYEYWINAGEASAEDAAGIYCEASRREGVISLVLQPDRWQDGHYPTPEAAADVAQQGLGD